jgi:hypothetical protein
MQGGSTISLKWTLHGRCVSCVGAPTAFAIPAASASARGAPQFLSLCKGSAYAREKRKPEQAGLLAVLMIMPGECVNDYVWVIIAGG